MPEPRTWSAGVLILEGDAATLRHQGHLRAINTLEKMISGLGVNRHSIESLEDVEAAMRWASWFPADGVVLVAHGSERGAVVAPGAMMDWSAIAEALAPVEPRVVLVVSCRGGLSFVAAEFFEHIPSLQCFIGSPVDVAAGQTLAGVFDFVREVNGNRLGLGWSVLASTVNNVVTGGVIFRRTREEWDGELPGAWVVQDVLGFIAMVLRKAAGDPFLVPETRSASQPRRRTRRRSSRPRAHVPKPA